MKNEENKRKTKKTIYHIIFLKKGVDKRLLFVVTYASNLRKEIFLEVNAYVNLYAQSRRHHT